MAMIKKAKWRVFFCGGRDTQLATPTGSVDLTLGQTEAVKNFDDYSTMQQYVASILTQASPTAQGDTLPLKSLNIMAFTTYEDSST